MITREVVMLLPGGPNYYPEIPNDYPETPNDVYKHTKIKKPSI